jgi:nucleoside-diphosphate-sugar epimerase
MKILVTGGYGFIGSHLVEKLMKERHHVTIIDDLSTGSPANLMQKPPIYTLSTEDKNCERLFAEMAFDIVIHLAQKPLPEESDDAFHEILHSNNIGLNNMLYLAHKYHVKKMIVLSSYHVYGRQNLLPIKEYARPVPVDPKGKCDLMTENFCEAYRKIGLNVIVLRLASVYGHRQPRNFIRELMEPQSDAESGNEKTMTNQIKDYIYVSDVIEAIYKVCERETSHVLNIASGNSVSMAEVQEIVHRTLNPMSQRKINFENNSETPKYRIDNMKARHQLEWSPKYSLEEGIKKTVERIEKHQRAIQRFEPLQKVIEKNSKWFKYGYSKYLENLIAGVFFTLLTYELQLNLAIKVDFLLIYIILINAYYGWQQGSISIAFAVIAYIWLRVTLEDLSLIHLFNNPNHILYMTLYFIIGISVGYVIDRMKFEKNMIQKELASVREELSFTNEMYDKSIEIKNTLQSTIENYEDSLGKIFSVVSKLENAIPEQIFAEAAVVFSKILKTEHVHIYYLNTAKYLRLVAVKGGQKYHRSLLVEDYEFLSAVIVDKKIFVNKTLQDNQPIICAPIVQEGSTKAVVFLDGVVFNNLTHQFLNTLKVLCYLVANAISKASEYEAAIHDKKYFGDTFIMKSEWFNKLIEEKKGTSTENEMPIYLLEFEKNQHSNEALYAKVSKIIRSTDYVGELNSERFAILLTNIRKEEVTVIDARLAEQGILTSPREIQWRPL